MDVSIITAVAGSANPEHVNEAVESVLSHETGAEIEWLIQEDGTSRNFEYLANKDPQIHYESNDLQTGPAATRNLALGRCAGRYVRNLDADDLLLPKAIDNALAVVDGVRFVTGPVLDLLPDGTEVAFADERPPGTIQPGELIEHWRTNNYFGAVHPTTLFAETDVVLEAGGWSAVPASEDTTLLFRINKHHTGHHLAEPVTLYRKHEDQITAGNWSSNPNNQKRRYRLVERLVDRA